MKAIISKFEGSLLNDPDPFSYFMLVAFEGSGLIRFGLLLLLWPVIRFLEATGMGEAGLRLTVFVALVGQRESEIESVARAVLPKFFMDDIDLKAWNMFINNNSHNKRVVVTKMPRIMAEMFLKEHLRADEVVGKELVVNRFGFATGFVKGEIGSVRDRVVDASVLSLSKEQKHSPFNTNNQDNDGNGDHRHLFRPPPVIFHDGRLVKRPTPSTALLILLWTPFGVLLATTRILVGLTLPMWATRHMDKFLGGEVIVRGHPPPPKNPGVLFVCTHRTLMDPVVLSSVLNRKIPAVTYSISKLSELLSPIPTVRLTRTRHVDAARIKIELSRGDLVVCPEGTTCREPFLLRFSALFAELTDRIVPVAMNCRVGMFHATTARGWKGLDPVFFFMNPWPVYEVTFLSQLPAEATCSAGRSPHDVANHVQRILAATLGFECTNLTRKDKYRVLAGNDGTVSYTSFLDSLKKVMSALVRPLFSGHKEKTFY